MVWGCENSDIKDNERLTLRKVGVGDDEGKVIKFNICHDCAQACCPPREEDPSKELTKFGCKEPDCKDLVVKSLVVIGGL